jgi:hypothetical protein
VKRVRLPQIRLPRLPRRRAREPRLPRLKPVARPAGVLRGARVPAFAAAAVLVAAASLASFMESYRALYDSGRTATGCRSAGRRCGRCTETKVAEVAGLAYTDLTDGRPARKPVIPAHWRTREAARSMSSSPPPGMGTPPPTTASACRATCS